MEKIRIKLLDDDEFSWQHAAKYWPYLQTIVPLFANTPNMSKFRKHLYFNILRWRQTCMYGLSKPFHGKSIALSRQLICLYDATTWGLTARVMFLSAQKHGNCRKYGWRFPKNLLLCILSTYCFFPDERFWRAILKAYFRQNTEHFCSSNSTVLIIWRTSTLRLSQLTERHIQKRQRKEYWAGIATSLTHHHAL